jgi:glycosyltransferase involved in cell wall biosynthesis
MNESVSVIINVYNEVDTIEREILSIHDKILVRLPGSELIVAEDGSTDGTKEIIYRYVEKMGIVHSTGTERKGYAKALKDAFALAKNKYIFFSDTGDKFDFDDFWKLYDVRHGFTLVIGVRSSRTDQRYRRLLTHVYNFLLRKYFSVKLVDADSGFRIYDKVIIEKLANEDWVNEYLIGSELALRTIYSGGGVGHVPVAYRQRDTTSRGLPLGKIPKVIVNVTRNFPVLRQVLTAPSYRKL